MAQDENGIPVNGDNKRKSADLLPRYFRTTANKKFLSSTIDQLIQPGQIEKVDGYIGRRDSKAFKSTDSYVPDVSADRENYQLEPVATISDNLDNTTYYGDYRDYVNASKIRNTNNANHSLYNAQEYYAWDPHINWDKFVNFREYYWLPAGPDEVPVYGNAREVKSTFAVKRQDNVDNKARAAIVTSDQRIVEVIIINSGSRFMRLPEIRITDETGFGAKLRPIMSITARSEYVTDAIVDATEVVFCPSKNQQNLS